MKPALTSILLAAAVTALPAGAQNMPPPPTPVAPAATAPAQASPAAPAPARPQPTTPTSAPAAAQAQPTSATPSPAQPPTVSDLLQTRVEQVRRGSRVVEVRVTGADGDRRYTMENRQDRPPPQLQGSGSGLSTPNFLKIEF